MADEIDMAQEAYEREMNAALSERLNQQVPTESPTHCVNCEEEIPEARRTAVPGCTRCKPCQESFELLNYWRN